MKRTKVLRRIATLRQKPEVLHTVARDLGVALCRGERDDLAEVGRALARHAPGPTETTRVASGAGDGSESGDSDYWAGFAAAMGMLLASYEAAHEHSDALAAARRIVDGDSARRIVTLLAAGPATGAELAAQLGLTPGAVSKQLKTLRHAGLARMLGPVSGDSERPERGAPKPHVLTPLGHTVADELADSSLARPARHASVG